MFKSIDAEIKSCKALNEKLDKDAENLDTDKLGSSYFLALKAQKVKNASNIVNLLHSATSEILDSKHEYKAGNCFYKIKTSHVSFTHETHAIEFKEKGVHKMFKSAVEFEDFIKQHYAREDGEEDKHVKRVNFETNADDDEEEDTGEEFLFEKADSEDYDCETLLKKQEEPDQEHVFEEEQTEDKSDEEERELSDLDKVCNLASILTKSVAFDEEDVALLVAKKAQLLKDDLKGRTSSKTLAKTHFQSTIEAREHVLTDAVRRGLLIPGSETFLFFVKKQAKLVDLAQKLY